MVDTPSQTDTYGTALDIFDRTHPLRVDAEENLKIVGTVTTTPSGTQNVNVTNTSLAVTDANVDRSFGTWAYHAGALGTVVIPAGQRVLGLTAHSVGGGTMVINGGDSITIPANTSFLVQPLGNLVAPTIVFTSTDAYFIEVVS